MAAEDQKAEAFLARLLANPAMQHFTPLQKEEQIIQFLHANAPQLAPTLTSPAYFAGKSWSDVFSMMVDALYRIVDRQLVPAVDQAVDRMTFSFVPFLRQQNVPYEKVKEQVLQVLKETISKPDARRAFTGPYATVHFRIVDKYIEEVYRRKSYIHREFTRVQGLKMSKEEVRELVIMSLLLKPAICLMAQGSAGPNSSTGTVQASYAKQVFGPVSQKLKLLPEPVVRSALNANVSFMEDRDTEATSRFAAVFAARSRNYHPYVKVDRGADSPDKSWLSIARRNYKFYGFDIKMLDEFYRIAAENGW